MFTATSVIAAGSDTTAVALRSFFYYLIKHPHHYRQCQDEIEKAIASGRLSLPVTYSQGVQLSHVQACIKESMRLHPPICWTLERIVPSGGLALGSHVVPGGTIVSVNSTTYHRSEKTYGSDCLQFKPERWLTEDEEERRRLERHNLTVSKHVGGKGRSVAKSAVDFR